MEGWELTDKPLGKLNRSFTLTLQTVREVQLICCDELTPWTLVGVARLLFGFAARGFLMLGE